MRYYGRFLLTSDEASRLEMVERGIVHRMRLSAGRVPARSGPHEDESGFSFDDLVKAAEDIPDAEDNHA